MSDTNTAVAVEFPFKTLCRCGHATSQHATTRRLTTEEFERDDIPCLACKQRVGRQTWKYVCRGFEEWPISEMPFPGTIEAYRIGCTCPPRTATGEPQFSSTCALHVWVCKRRDPCTHLDPQFLLGSTGEYQIDHTRSHSACEHCTVPQIVCTQCGKIWDDWRVSALSAGWLQLSPETENLLPVWRCGTCRT